jgi:hypothetical protein
VATYNASELNCLSFDVQGEDEVEEKILQVFEMFETIEIISQSQSTIQYDSEDYINITLIVKGKWKE